MRLADSYLNLSGHHCHKLKHPDVPLNIPASRFLRPWTKTGSFMNVLHLRRIKQSMSHAARSGALFHLWWHPHNFGINTKENLDSLEEILSHYRMLKERYGMQSFNMGELADLSGHAKG